MQTALDLCLGALPSLALMVFFYLKDHYEPEPHGHVAAAFGLGVVAFAASYFGGTALAGLVDPVWLAIGGFPAHLFEAGVLAGGVEEVAKWLVLFAVVVRWDEFDEPLDGLIYGVAVALGLATVENVLYVHRVGLGQGLLRAVLAVPAHALFGAAMGTQFGRAKLGRGRHEGGARSQAQAVQAIQAGEGHGAGRSGGHAHGAVELDVDHGDQADPGHRPEFLHVQRTPTAGPDDDDVRGRRGGGRLGLGGNPVHAARFLPKPAAGIHAVGVRAGGGTARRPSA